MNPKPSVPQLGLNREEKRIRPRWTGAEAVVLALGANLGDRWATMKRARDALDRQGIRVVRASTPLWTRPIEGSEGPGFLNLCLQVQTSLDPHALLHRCQAIERAFGRRRLRRWGPRTLDIDLVFYGRQRIDSPTLTLPHPAWRERDFVLRGVLELGVPIGTGPPMQTRQQFQSWLADAEPCILSPYSRPLGPGPLMGRHPWNVPL